MRIRIVAWSNVNNSLSKADVDGVILAHSDNPVLGLVCRQAEKDAKTMTIRCRRLSWNWNSMFPDIRLDLCLILTKQKAGIS